MRLETPDLCNVHLANLGLFKYFLRCRIPNLPLFEPHSSCCLHQPLPPIYPSIRQHNRIILNETFAVVSVGQVAR